VAPVVSSGQLEGSDREVAPSPS